MAPCVFILWYLPVQHSWVNAAQWCGVDTPSMMIPCVHVWYVSTHVLLAK